MATIEERLLILENEFLNIKNNSQSEVQLSSTTTPSVILVAENGEIKKINGIPLILEVLSDKWLLKEPNGTIISEIDKPI